MKVLEQNVLYSDVHTPISLYFKQIINHNTEVTTNVDETFDVINKWDNSKENAFIDAI